MSKRISRAQRAKNLINKGYSNKYIFEHFPYIPKATVYYARSCINKKKGIASLPTPAPVASGTGITSSAIPLEFEIIDRPEDKKAVKASNNRRNAQLKRWERERHLKEIAQLDNIYGRTVLVTPPLTLWQKIKSFFVGA